MQGVEVQSVIELNELIFELSYNCNFACEMCGFGGRVVNDEYFMSLARLKQIAAGLRVKPKAVRLNGRGESTIHSEFIEIMRYVRGQYPHSLINLFTNLSADSMVIDEIVRARVQLFISMDSPDMGRLKSIRRGLVEKTFLRNIEKLATAVVRPFIIFTLQELNFEDIVPIAQFAAEHNFHLLINTVRRDKGIESFQQLVRDRRDFLSEQFAEAEQIFINSELMFLAPDQVQGVKVREPKDTVSYGSLKQCPAIDGEVCILYDGTVTPCNMFNPYSYGNIREKSLIELRNSEEFRWFRKNHRQLDYCRNCACLGGTS